MVPKYDVNIHMVIYFPIISNWVLKNFAPRKSFFVHFSVALPRSQGAECFDVYS